MLYKDELLEHYKHPYNKCRLEETPSFTTELYNPSCGDSISMEGVIQDGILIKLCFQGSGCVISQATASILVEESEQKPITNLLALTADDIVKLVGIELGPVRLKCALLSLQVLQEGLRDYTEKSGDKT